MGFFESRLFARMGVASAVILAAIFGWIAIDQGALSVLAALLFSMVAGALSDWASVPFWALLMLVLLFEIHRRA